MGKKKQTTTQTQNTTQNTNQSSSGSSAGQYASQNFYGEYVPSNTADMDAFRGFRPQSDPGLSFQYGNARNKLQQSLSNPTGGYRTAAMDDAILRSGNRGLAQDEAQAYRSGQYDVNQIRSGQLGSLAALTRPSLIQTGAAGMTSGTSSGQSQGQMTGNMSGTGTQVQSGGMLGDILGAAAGVGGAALMLLLLCFGLSLAAHSERGTMRDSLSLADGHRATISSTPDLSSSDTFGSLVEKDAPFDSMYFSRRRDGRLRNEFLQRSRRQS